MASKKYGYMATIGANTSGLTSALQTMDAEAKKVSAEIREINNNLKFEDGGTVALQQKYELLQKAIEQTKEKLETLKKAEADVNVAAENGKISEANQRSFQRELDSTSNKLTRYQNELEKTRAAIDGVGDSAETSSTEIKNSFKKAEKSVKDYDKSLDDANKTTVTFGDLVKANILGDIISNAFHRAADAVGDFIKQGIKLASDLTEVQNVVDVTFGDDAAQIYEWADAAAESFGISSLQAQNFTGTLGAMLKSQGIANDSILEMSENLAGLAGDMASFYNIDVEQAFEKIRSGISGETEPLKQLGINMNVANMEAYALSQGIEKTWNSMDVAEQTMLRYNYLLSQTADAQGDFARTSDSYANQQRILELQTQNLAASFGEKLLPMVNDLTGTLNENMPQIGDKIETVGNIVVGLFDFVIDHHEAILAVITGIGTALAAQKGAKAVGDITSAVKDLFSTVKSGQGVMSALAASLNTQPWVLAVGAIAAVTAGLVALASEAFKTSTALKEAAEASVQAYEDEKTKVAELEAELDGVNQKIDEIQSKGKLSFTEAEELANLKLQNGELSTQLDFEEKILETKKRQAEYDLYNAVKSEDTGEEGTVAYIEDRIAAYKEAAGYVESLQEELNEAIADGNELLAEDLREKMRPFEEAATKEELRIEESTAALNKLAENLDLTTESGREAKAAVDDLVKKVSEMFDITESEKELISSDIMDPYAAGSALSTTGKYYETQGKLAAEATEKEKAAREQDLKDYVAGLNEKQDLRRISEEEYYDELYGYLIAHEDRESVEWFKQLGRYEDYQQKLANAAEKTAEDEQKAEKDRQDAEKKAYEQQIENQVEALKERKELNDDFTDEMYYNELETIIAALDKESDLYKKYNSEILKGRKELADDLDDEAVKSAKEQAEAVTSQFEKAYAEIKSKREQLLNDFRNIELTETVKDKNGKDKLILKDLDAEIKRLDRYEASIDRLREKGISENLMAEIMNLDYASGTRQDYIDTLLSIPQNKLEQYDRELNALKERQEEAADNAVAEARKNTDKQAEKAMDDVTKMFSGMTKTAYEKGAETIENFYQGMIDSMRDVNDLGTISRVLDSVFSETSGKSGASGKAYSSGSGLTVGESYIAASTPIVINIDNKKYVEMTLNDIIDRGARSGGNPFHL